LADALGFLTLTLRLATGEMGFSVINLRGSNPEPLMSALGQKRTSEHVRSMSALPPKADIGTQSRDVHFVPKADILRCSKVRRYSITSSARASSLPACFVSNMMTLAQR
jgi:hypothetical protein